MGICASSQLYTKSNEHGMITFSTVQVISSEGKLQEYKLQQAARAIKAEQVLSQNPGCLLCSAESMFLGAPAPQMGPTEELHRGQIYFLLPLSQYSKAPLSLQDLCALAIKASAALSGPTSKDSGPGFLSSAGAYYQSVSLPVLPKA